MEPAHVPDVAREVALISAGTFGPQDLSDLEAFSFHLPDSICILFAFMMFSRFTKRYLLYLL